MKKIFIVNGVGGSGKDTFEKYVGRYIPTYKYSIVDLPKEAARLLGWDGAKNDNDRKFLSDIMDLSSGYNDMPFRDVKALVKDFRLNKIKASVLFIDMRSPKDIERATIEFGAETILIRNPNKKKIKSNHADADVEKYRYDYIIENDGTLEQLEKAAKLFVFDVICGEYIPEKNKPFTLTCSKY